MSALWPCVCASLISVRAAAQCPDGTPPPCPRPAIRSLPASLAVLPLESHSPDTADAYLADGLTDELIQRLQSVGLPVLSRLAVLRFRGTARAPAEIGQSLNAAYLLTGTLRRSRQTVRIVVELVRAESGARLWGDTFDRPTADVLAVETEVALRVAEAIAGRLQPAARRVITAHATTSGPAFEAYLRGNVELARRTGLSAQRAIAAYAEATRLDPGFVKAWARTSLAYGLAALYRWPEFGIPRDSLLARGAAAAGRAMALDSSEAESWMARGYPILLSGRRDAVDAAIRVLERAAVIDPNNAEIHQQLGFALAQANRLGEAEAEFRRALAIEPGRRVTLFSLALVAYYRRDPRASVPWCDSVLAIEPWFMGYTLRAQARLALGDTAGSRRDAETARRLQAPYVSPRNEATLALLDVRSGDSVAARQRLLQLEHPAAPIADDPLGTLEAHLAAIRLALGDRDGALRTLESARDRDWRFYWSLAAEPTFDGLSDEPRFRRLLQESRPW